MTTQQKLEALQSAIRRLLVKFQARAAGFAKQGTEKGNALSNEYLVVISDIGHSIAL